MLIIFGKDRNIMANCDGLNKNGFSKSIANGTVRRCGLVGEDVTFLVEVCH